MTLMTMTLMTLAGGVPKVYERTRYMHYDNFVGCLSHFQLDDQKVLDFTEAAIDGR